MGLRRRKRHRWLIRLRADVIPAPYDEGYMPRCSHAALRTHRPRPFAPSPRTPPVPARLRTLAAHRPRPIASAVPRCAPRSASTDVLIFQAARTRIRSSPRRSSETAGFQFLFKEIQTFTSFYVSLPNVSKKDVKGLLSRK